MSDRQENRANRSIAERVPAFSAFRYPGFAYLWSSTLLWSAARWMERVVLWWYVYQITESAFLLGVVTAVQWVPLLLLGPWTGVVADRFDRRRTIIFAQVLMLAVPLAMAYLIMSGQVQLWHIIIVVLISGTGVALDQPARQALLYDQVGREGAMNAQALYRLARHGPLILGALIAGGLMQQIGAGPAFFAVAATYLVGLALTFLIPTPPKMSEITSAWKHLLEGLSYIKGNRILLALFGVEIAGDIFGLPFQMLLPVLARDVLGVGPMGYSILFAASGVGELGAALTIASLGDFKAKRWLLLVGTFAFGAVLIPFAASPWYPLSVLLIMGVGAAHTTSMTTLATLLLTVVPDAMRGRVMGMWIFTWSAVPVGSLQAGYLATLISAPWALGLSGAALAIFTLAIRPFVKRLD